MDSNKESIEVRSQKSEVRRKGGGGRMATGLLAILLGLVFTPDLRAQAFVTGGTAALGNFKNPTSVTDGGARVCNFTLRIDLKLGKILAIPYSTSAGAACDQIPVDITALTFSTGITSFDGSTGVLEVGDFTLQAPTWVGSGAGLICCWASFLSVIPNDNNTPLVIRSAANGTVSPVSTGTVAITPNASPAVSIYILIDGAQGDQPTGSGDLLRGVGGVGGPGGYRGGDGGNGGISPTPGQAGFGPGGGPGGDVGSSPLSNARFLTTGRTIAGTPIPAGNDLLLMLRGGSGGGGSGGTTNGVAGHGGGGGGGAIAIYADNSITIGGAIFARGGQGSLCCGGPVASSGSGGVIRLVTKTIAGGGTLDAGSICCNAADSGIIRLEAFTISYTGTLTGNLAAASAPGQVVMPTAPPAFLRFLTVTDSSNPLNTIGVPGATQATPGRTGNIANVDVTLPNPSGPATTVNLTLEAGPNTIANPFPAGKSVTVVVQALDPVQQLLSKSYPATSFVCPSPGSGNCTATVSGVSLPLGFSSMSAFTVVNLTQAGTLARIFPPMYQGEAIEAVRMETTGSDTKYVLIAKSGREFSFQPGGVSTNSIAEEVRAGNP